MIRIGLSCITLTLLLTSCGIADWADVGISDPEPIPTVEKEYAFDGVKLIAKYIHTGEDARSMRQTRYEIRDDSRLLLRLENFLSHVEEIHIGEEHRVVVELTLDEDEVRSSARTALRVCPIMQNWMMLATWRYAHPFGTSGIWKDLGGDFDPSGCMEGLTIKEFEKKLQPKEPEEEESAVDEINVAEDNQAILLFDATEWFINYAQAHAFNYGWVVTSKTDRSIKIHGDTSINHSPRVRFHKILF